METGRTAKAAALAREVISQAGTSIVLKMRFLDMAVFKLKPAASNIPLATDGVSLFYHPLWLLKHYQEEPNEITRDYMHVILHCIFSHPFINSEIDHGLWDLSCDIAVESVIEDLNLSILSTRADVKKSSAIKKLKARVGELTAEKLYRYFQTERPPYGWAALFQADLHDIWYNRGSSAPSQEESASGSSEQTDDHSGNDGNHQNRDDSEEGSGSNPDDDSESNDESGGSNPHGSNGSNDPTGRQGEPSNSALPDWMNASRKGSQAAAEWKNISEHIQMDLESFAKEQGYTAGSLSQALAAVNREKYDYDTFLKKFAVLGEVMKINDDEFDYIFYTYGLKLFGNMPLIEPLEYKEEKRIREFVIAIDTSGSTSGPLVQSFLTKTYNILQSTASFFARVKIYIIQCDAEIQEAVQITGREEFENYLRHMRLKGFGGTDFRPVFSYVDELIRKKEFTNLNGLLYFTDGYGTFPERMPVYRTAFVFVKNSGSNYTAVPPWAMKLELEESEIQQFS